MKVDKDVKHFTVYPVDHTDYFDHVNLVNHVSFDTYKSPKDQVVITSKHFKPQLTYLL